MKDIKQVLSDKSQHGWTDSKMSRDKYRGQFRLNPSSLSAGLIGLGEVDPLAIKQAWESPDSQDRTPAAQDRMNCGTLAHLLILQPELLREKVAVWDGRRAGAKWEEFESENADKLIMRECDYVETCTAIKAMHMEPFVVDLVRGIDAEVAVFGSEQVNTCDKFINVMGQVDGINFDKQIIMDLKTTERGIDRRSVERTIRTFHNREKMSAYRRWVAAATDTEPEEWRCYNLFALMTPPYGIHQIKFTSMSLDWGWDRMQGALESVGTCLQSNTWPIYAKQSVMDVESYECEDEEKEMISYE